MQRIYLKVVLKSGYVVEDIHVGDVNSYASEDIRKKRDALEAEFQESEQVVLFDLEHAASHVFQTDEVAYWEVTAREWRNPRGW